MKFRVHGYEIFRIAHEVEANSTKEAIQKYTDEVNPHVFDNDDIEWAEDETAYYLVDPIFPNNNEVDYENSKWVNGQIKLGDNE